MRASKPIKERRNDAIETVIESVGLSSHITDGGEGMDRDTHIHHLADHADVTVSMDGDGKYAFIDFYNPEETVETSLSVDQNTAESLEQFFHDLARELGKE